MSRQLDLSVQGVEDVGPQPLLACFDELDAERAAHAQTKAQAAASEALLDRALAELHHHLGHEASVHCGGCGCESAHAVLADPLAQSRLAAINASKEAGDGK